MAAAAVAAPPRPRVLLTLLLVVTDKAAHGAVRAVARSVGEAGTAPRDVLSALSAAVPALAPLVDEIAVPVFAALS